MNNFNEKVVENLQHEVECLNHSLAKAREDKNFSMYKNLINSYRETVMLINELQKDDDKPITIKDMGVINDRVVGVNNIVKKHNNRSFVLLDSLKV